VAFNRPGSGGLAKACATKSLCFAACRYLSLHFGPLEIAFADFLAEIGILADGLDFPKKCGDLVMSWAQRQGAATGRALDLGCAVGR